MGTSDLLLNGTFPIVEYEFIVTVKITAGVTSILSIFGASLIIFTFIAFSNLRTTARQLLVNLSIADIIVAMSHFVGLFENFERFIPHYNFESWNTSTIDPLCRSQAAFSMFGTLASFFWSLAIGVYLVSLSIWTRKRAKKLLPVIYLVCWGIPAVMVIPMAVNQYFGYALAADIGWCYISRVAKDDPGYTGYLVAEIIGYEIWVYLVFIALPILYITAYLYIHYKLRRKANYQPLASTPSQGSDVKLLFVPVAFLLLRIWSTLIDIVVFYIGDDQNLRTTWIAVLVVLAGIGDNAQGIVNAIIFCVFTRQVRKQLLSKKSYMKMCSWKHSNESAVDEATSQFENDRQFYYDTSLSYTTNAQSQFQGSTLVSKTVSE